MGDFAEVFATPTLAALLAEFALHPERTYYQKELVERVGGSLYLVQRELKRMERAGLVSRETRGRQVEYRFNRSHPAASGLQDALLKTVALADRLRAALDGAEGIELAFIFGSVAVDDADADSDLDLMFVGTLGLRDVAARLMPVVRGLGREPNIIVMRAQELAEKAVKGDHFISALLAAPKIWLRGDDDELKRVLGRPQAP